MTVSSDRWTCPRCNSTIVFSPADDEIVRTVVRQAQEQHAAAHQAQDDADFPFEAAGVTR